ncbi:protein of unknown function [Methanoculleus bourgensis]|uniref:Uncharacterized protein n=1 Tax=Methanoculleus bourgensis TaxID=83986 RepID=A0A0X3BLD9_9EURY|nr:protein of unknown function [Methanoculleus bourgensis]
MYSAGYGVPGVGVWTGKARCGRQWRPAYLAMLKLWSSSGDRYCLAGTGAGKEAADRAGWGFASMGTLVGPPGGGQAPISANFSHENSSG